MRLTALHVDGFGVFCDQTLANMAPGLTVFLGSNEAGKSTLLAFLRAMPYGFEDARTRLPRYEPLAGGNHGGWIEAVTQAGRRVRLDRRRGRRVTGEAVLRDLDTDESLGAEAVPDLLARTPREVFFNVYAFSLAELQELEYLATEQVSGRIWTAGLGLGDVSLVDVERALRARAQELHKPGGSKPPVNQTLRTLADLRQQLRQARTDLERYETDKSAVTDLETQTRQRGEDSDQLRRDLQRLEQARKAWPIYAELRTRRDELSALGPAEPFPADGVRRLEQLLAKRDAFAARAHELADDLVNAQNRRKALVVEDALLAQQSRIEGITREEQRLGGCLNDLPGVRAYVTKGEQDLAEELRELGPDWDEARLETFDLSLPVMVAAGELGAQVEGGGQGVREAERELVGASRAVEGAEKGLSEVRAALTAASEPPIRDPEELRLRRQAVGAARQALGDLQNAEWDAVHLRERAADLARQRSGASAPDEEGESVPAVWMVVALGLLIAAAFVAVTRSLLGIAVGLLSGAAVAGALLYLRSRLQHVQADRQERARATLVSLDGLLSDTGQRLEATEGRMAEARARLDEAVRVLGESLANQAEIEGVGQRLDEARELLGAYSQAQKAVVDSERALKTAVEAREQLQQDRLAATQSLTAAQEAWEEWLRTKELAPTITPAGFAEMVQAIRRLREARKDLVQRRERVTGMQRLVNEIAASAADLWQACGRQVPTVEELPHAIVTLSRELTDARRARALAEQIDQEQLPGLESGGRRAREELKTVEADLTTLIQQANAANQEDFRWRGDLHAKREVLEQAVSDGERALGVIAGFGDERQAFEAELEQIDPSGIDPRISQTQQKLEEVDRELAELNQRLGARQRDLAQLEASDRIAQLLQYQGALQEQLKEQVEEYATVTAALYLLRKTRQKYEAERQPAVLAETSRCFERITAGRYRRVFAPFGETTLNVELAGGGVKLVEQLSRGTQQQLYLSMRLGYLTVQHRTPGAEPLPLIMDEVLVNFDPERARRTAELVLETARENQVFVFTCHPETATLFCELEPRVSVVSVVSGQIVPADSPSASDLREEA